MTTFEVLNHEHLLQSETPPAEYGQVITQIAVPREELTSVRQMLIGVQKKTEEGTRTLQ